MVVPLAILVCLAFGQAAAPRSKGAEVIVEEVLGHSAGEGAGIQAGDVIAGWSRADPSDLQPGRGRVEHPFDLTAIEVEQAPRGTITLIGRRGGHARSWRLPPGPWEIKVRPALSKALLGLNEEGRMHAAAGRVLEAANRWRLASDHAKKTRDSRLAAWFLTRAAEALATAHKWMEADAAFARAVEILGHPAVSSDLPQVLFRWGNSYRTRGLWDRAEECFRLALADYRKRSQRLSIANTLSGLGMVAYARGNLTLAEEAYREAFGIKEAMAPRSLETARSLNQLGNVARSRGDVKNAESLYRRALEIEEALKPGGLESARTLVNLGTVAGDRRDLKAEDEYYRRALAVQEKLAPNSLELATTLCNIGIMAENRSDLAGAENLYRRALAIQERLAPDSLELARTLHNLGNIPLRRGDVSQADALYQRALVIREKLSPGSIPVATTISNLGLIAQRRGDLALAEDRYRRALQIREKWSPGSPAVGTFHVRLGSIAYERGDLRGAKEHYQRALAIYEKVNPESLDTAEILRRLGDVEAENGDLDAAEKHLGRALALQQKQAPDGLDVASSLSSLGIVAAHRGDLATAEQHYRRALAIRERLAPETVAPVLDNFGVVLWGRGDLDGAEDLHKRALALREKQNKKDPQIPRTLNNLGNVARSRGDLARAEDLYQLALAQEEQLSPGSQEVGRFLNNLGSVARVRGDLASAQLYYTRALAIREAAGASSLPVAATLDNLGLVLTARGNPTAAEAHHRRALAISQRLAPGSMPEASSWHGLGRALRGTGRPREAAVALLRALDTLERQKTTLGGTEGVRSGFVALHDELYKDALLNFVELDDPSQAFHVLERSRARSLLTMLAERDLIVASDLPPDIARERKLADTEYDRTQAAVAALNPDKDAARIDELLARLRDVRARQEAIADRIRKASPRFGALQYPQPLGLSDVGAALDSDTVLLAYSVGEEKTVVFTVSGATAGSPSGPRGVVVTLPIGAQALAAKVQTFRRLIGLEAAERGLKIGTGTSPDSEGALTKEARELYDLLIKPAEAAIDASARVLISPDGALHGLPFAALRRPGRRARFLIEWKPLHIVVSGTVYVELQKRRRPDGAPGVPTMVAFGDPVYPNLAETTAPEFADVEVRAAVRRAGAFRPLPATRREVEQIATLYAGHARIWLGMAATEEQAKNIGRDVRYLHFASHGVLDPRIPLNSALALTLPRLPAEGQDNGLLQAWEIFEHLRLDADLVTLSACETGLGQDMGGEGLIGLVRAFQYAGARTVMASLWSVADDSTATLMTKFYSYLKAGRTKDEALRSAQRDLIRRRAEAHPFHWAAFQLIGDWQ